MGTFEATEEQLIAALQKGDNAAFKEIYERYWEKLYRIAINRLNNDQEIAAELLQDVFLDLWEKRAKLAIYKSLPSYIFCSLKYKILNHFRKEAIRRRHREEVRYTQTEEDFTTINQLSFDELYQQLHESLEKLPDQCRLIFKMSRFEDMSSKEIAAALRISPKTVDNQINKALKIIRTSADNFSPEIS